MFNLLNEFVQFKKDTYLPFAIIERRNLKNPTTQYFAFSPLSVINKTQNFQLEPSDVVILYSQTDIDNFVEIYGDNKTIPNPDLDVSINDRSSPFGNIDELISSLIVRIESAVNNPGPKVVAGP